MTTDAWIADLIRREGGYTDDPIDAGGPTKYGITAATLGQWRGLGRPATADEVRALDIPEATALYRQQYVAPFAAIPFDELRAQCIDYGVHSGVETAIRALQTVVGVTVDGVLGPQTIRAVGFTGWRVVNGALVAARVRHLVAITQHDPTQRRFFYGWIVRASAFLV